MFFELSTNVVIHLHLPHLWVCAAKSESYILALVKFLQIH